MKLLPPGRGKELSNLASTAEPSALRHYSFIHIQTTVYRQNNIFMCSFVMQMYQVRVKVSGPQKAKKQELSLGRRGGEILPLHCCQNYLLTSFQRVTLDRELECKDFALTHKRKQLIYWPAHFQKSK